MAASRNERDHNTLTSDRTIVFRRIDSLLRQRDECVDFQLHDDVCQRWRGIGNSEVISGGPGPTSSRVRGRTGSIVYKIFRYEFK